VGKGHREKYERYIASSRWFAKRLQYFASIRGPIRCRGCGTGNEKTLHVHHRTYIRLGREDLSDLVAVCVGCHDEIHSTHKQMKDSGQRVGLVECTDLVLTQLREHHGLDEAPLPPVKPLGIKPNVVRQPSMITIRRLVACSVCCAAKGHGCKPPPDWEKKRYIHPERKQEAIKLLRAGVALSSTRSRREARGGKRDPVNDFFNRHIDDPPTEQASDLEHGR
jgi:hypothetical protein